MKKKALVLTHRNIDTGPRLNWERLMIAENFDLTIIGQSIVYSNKIMAFTSFYPKWNRLINWLFRKFFFLKITNHIGEYYPKIKAYLLKEKFDLIIIHEINLLPLLSRLKKNNEFKIVFNAHEYHPLEFEDKPNWLGTQGRYYYKMYQQYLYSVDLLINICNMIADKCFEEFHKKSLIIPNVTPYIPLITKPTDKFPIKMIHHGGAMPSRKLENMIEMASLLGDNYSLDLMLTKSDLNYYEYLQSLCDKTKNVKLIAPVAFNEIVPKLNNYDLGIVLVPPVNFNYKAGLGNKFFEFIQARLCIAIGPLPEMQRYVEQYQLGVVSNTFEAADLATTIHKLSFQEINNYKANAHIASNTLNTDSVYKFYETELMQLFRA